jgi:hypothetical protein
MKWPFRRKREETDLRLFRNPKTNELTLSMKGSVGFPLSWIEPIVQMNVNLTTPISDNSARLLRDQLNTLVKNDE